MAVLMMLPSSSDPADSTPLRMLAASAAPLVSSQPITTRHDSGAGTIASTSSIPIPTRAA